MRRSGLFSLIFIVVLGAGAVAWTLVVDNRPQLGLDLQGGASVVLQPVGDVDDEQLDQAIEIIRNRVDALGVAEPDIARQGDAIVVQLPGVEDQRRALEVVGRTAELRFRPVLRTFDPLPEGAESTTTTTTPGETTTTAPGGTTTTTAPAAGEPGEDEPSATTEYAAACGAVTADDDDPAETVILPGTDANDDGRPDTCYELGPVPLADDGFALGGSAINSASARIPQNEWVVNLDFTGDGLSLFNDVAESCFNFDATCPTRQIGITLDGRVESAPSIQPDQQVFEPFGRDGVTISGGSGNPFTEREAKDLALVLRYGALPVQLEAQTVQTVSATLGEDSLRAGLAAGIGGIILVALYMLLYYRALGLVVVVGLSIWASFLFAIVAYLGENSGLALSLAGVTGIIVSIGVTVDSYVVYFERLKDEIRSGRTVRSSVERGFKRAFRTILTADVSSFIGAALLYWLTVGPVRGFAFFLGLSTVLDVAVSWFFTRPMVALLARSRFFTEARWVGVARGLGVEHPPAASAAGAVAGAGR